MKQNVWVFVLYWKDDKLNLQTSFKIFYHICVFFQRCELLRQLAPYHRNLQLCNKCCQGSECNKKLCIGESALEEGLKQKYSRCVFFLDIYKSFGNILVKCECYAEMVLFITRVLIVVSIIICAITGITSRMNAEATSNIWWYCQCKLIYWVLLSYILHPTSQTYAFK